jgi:hypothetical protein
VERKEVKRAVRCEQEPRLARTLALLEEVQRPLEKTGDRREPCDARRVQRDSTRRLSDRLACHSNERRVRRLDRAVPGLLVLEDRELSCEVGLRDARDNGLLRHGEHGELAVVVLGGERTKNLRRLDVISMFHAGPVKAIESMESALPTWQRRSRHRSRAHLCARSPATRALPASQRTDLEGGLLPIVDLRFVRPQSPPLDVRGQIQAAFVTAWIGDLAISAK